MSAPRVSVIIATYNRSAVLRHAVASVLAQTFTDFELLVVGDGCTDDSASVVASFSDPRIRWFNLAVNSGHQSVPNNEGLRHARGDLIAYLGHDDLWFPHHLEARVAAIDAGADLAAGLTEIVGAGGRHLDIAPRRLSYSPGIWLPPTALLHRRAVVERIGEWHDYRELRIDPEADLIQRAIAAGFKLVILERLTAIKFPAAMRRNVYRSTDDSEQASWLSRIASDPDIERHEMIRLIYAGVNGQIPRAYRQIWRDLGCGTLLVIRARLQRLRNYLAGPGGKIDAARRRKGLQPMP